MFWSLLKDKDGYLTSVKLFTLKSSLEFINSWGSYKSVHGEIFRSYFLLRNRVLLVIKAFKSTLKGNNLEEFHVIS